MVRIARYGRILEALKQDKYSVTNGHVVNFEDIQLSLSLKHYHLALFCILSLRPANKTVATQLWQSIIYTEDNNGDVPRYISAYAEAIYFEILYSNTDEQKARALSIANSKTKNPAYKGDILAININTHATISFTGPNELRLYGFNPSAVYNCVNKRKSSYTHKGYAFVRLSGELDEEA